MTQTQIFKFHTKIRPPYAEKSYLFLTWNSKNSGNNKKKRVVWALTISLFLKGGWRWGICNLYYLKSSLFGTTSVHLLCYIVKKNKYFCWICLIKLQKEGNLRHFSYFWSKILPNSYQILGKCQNSGNFRKIRPRYAQCFKYGMQTNTFHICQDGQLKT